ncbi:hypothetical protein EV200_102621 [Pedobacter psychrotolerans]|uniref:Uncharacterized protein n=1 Tax=Pedobacter psychrotolerans TaxID=1843235 RepID=A0A4R2HJM0_9SPHI|nr:hypothetical protein [Pedobacter psychrotolerans]TCO29199.1 hypothetical protein EV200_102621 [Pedobacter psychrotolerans]GGE54950.1 hypothetical protein GCM10011413_21640 [Pedobacter psychrotolerans]
MDTVLLEITNEKAYKLIQDLEALDIVKILEKNAKPKESLSKRFAGSLNLTDQQYEDFQQHIIDSKSEWERDI